MPEDIPKAVIVLVWLLTGTITLGALIMHSTYLNVFIFAIIFYGVPVAWQILKSKDG